MKKNPFSKIAEKQSKIDLQEVAKEVVVKKRIGRPRRPNMTPVLVRMDKFLLARVDKEADKLIVSRSAVIAMALRKYFS